MKLTELEISIINDILDFNHEKSEAIKTQLSHLTIKKREFTGFRIYVIFDLDNQSDLLENFDEAKLSISSPTEYYLDSLEFQISSELNLTSTGKLLFLEIVPNGISQWDGKYSTFIKVET